MATVPLPPNRARYIRIFGISLIVIVAALLFFLFGVHMEASAPATGVLQAKDKLNLRAPIAGLIELGWYEGEETNVSGKQLVFRVDARGDGLADGGAGLPQPIQNYRLADGHSLAAVSRRFHKLATGDHVWPGQVLAWIRSDALGDASKLGAAITDPAPPVGKTALQLSIHVPTLHSLWQVLKIHAEPGAAVAAGDSLMTLAPIDPESHEPVDVVAHLEIAEEASEELAAGQIVRLQSSVYHSRLHGVAEGKLLSIDPLAESHPDGKRYFHAIAAVQQSPFPLRLGSSVSAKIVIGRKSVYQIILEH